MPKLLAYPHARNRTVDGVPLGTLGDPDLVQVSTMPISWRVTPQISNLEDPRSYPKFLTEVWLTNYYFAPHGSVK